ncbi:MAG: hypothetical protein DI551_01615 [Micavibrio aeruginosavorus]|uniref:Uncharacterized protein n=1 Tax=Micavibrio aeruginosavorus TaxID=349221 RepID=A0A2W5N5Q9_9BACT|nr:MAG: hypothetical protein DI551_01615 [Micavibrio aeruginosavorus]
MPDDVDGKNKKFQSVDLYAGWIAQGWGSKFSVLNQGRTKAAKIASYFGRIEWGILEGRERFLS